MLRAGLVGAVLVAGLLPAVAETRSPECNRWVTLANRSLQLNSAQAVLSETFDSEIDAKIYVIRKLQVECKRDMTDTLATLYQEREKQRRQTRVVSEPTPAPTPVEERPVSRFRVCETVGGTTACF